MNWLLLIFVMLVVFFLGIIIGQRFRYFPWIVSQAPVAPRSPQTISEQQYFKGLNYLLNDDTDQAIAIFIQMFQVTPETVETHLALGNLLRRRGEIDKAIQIHQNLLANADAHIPEINAINLELARDFMAAGLLDRAERLLKKLALPSMNQQQKNSKQFSLQLQSMHFLLDIFQQTKDWDQAIWIGEQLIRYEREKYQHVLANFFCEKAQLLLQAGNFDMARTCIDRAFWYDHRCVRASLIVGDLEFKLERYKQAIKALKRILAQNSAMFAEAVHLIKQCYDHLNQADECEVFLSERLEKSVDSYLALTIFDVLIEKTKNPQRLYELLIIKLQEKPSLLGLKWLIECKFSDRLPEKVSEQLILNFVARLLENKAKYRCDHCGFSSKILYWSCPGCRHWNSIKPQMV